MRWTVALALWAAACDSQVDADYGGEPLVVLAGAAMGAGTIERMEIRWNTTDPLGPGESRSPLSVQLSFPSVFEAAVVGTPPPDGLLAFDGDGEPRFAEGYLFALAGGRTTGADFDRALVWLEEAAPEGSAAAAYLGAALEAGFHVMARTPTPVVPPEQVELVSRCIARAVAGGWGPPRAESACSAMRSYRLAPSPAGSAERWLVRSQGAP